MEGLDAEKANVTVKGHFDNLVSQYMTVVVNNEAGLSSADPRLLASIHRLVVEFEEFWRRAQSTGAFSLNESLDDYSTTALEMLWVPYVIADLYQRFQDAPPPPLDASAAITTASRQQQQQGEQQRMRGEQEVVARERRDGEEYVSAYRTFMRTRQAELGAVPRQEALARSHEWFKLFFEWMQNVELLEEVTVERYAVYRADQRTARIELSRQCTQLRAAWSECEARVGYMRAKRRRMRELLDADDGGDGEEAGGEEEEVLRERALARLRWSCYDACHQLQLSSREAEMLEAVAPAQRAAISAEYQATMDAVRRGELSLGRQTYTILPGGNMAVGTPQHPVAVPAQALRDSGGVTVRAPSQAQGVGVGAGADAAAERQRMAAVVAEGQYAFRQRVRDELQVDRNGPTMTLQEFAELEMADVQRQMEDAAALQMARAEEDARLGPEGIEERQRIKDSKWADWKDAHPANGITAKGNYS